MYRGVSVVAKTAELLGKTVEAEQYSLLANDIANAFNSLFLNTTTGEYGVNRAQTANLLPLVTGIVPGAQRDAVLNTITTSIMDQYQGHLHTGTTGTLSMIEGLTKFGRGDVMYEVVTQTNYPGWGYMVAQGATTIWENWGLMQDAESMIMWCMIDQFFYNDLAGIKGPEYMGPGYMTPGFKNIVIRPYIPDDLTYAKASMKSMHGTIVSDWKKEANGVFTFIVTVPANTTADIHVPKINYNTTDWVIQEKQGVSWQNGAWVPNTPGITLGWEENEYIVFQAGSGEYRFQTGPSALVSVVPPKLSLSFTRNFPNPFNSATTITYRVSGEGKANVTLKIFDMNGALVKELVNQPHTPGSYTAHWDGNDFRGSAASQGAYIYRLEAGEDTGIVGKMLKM
jgi:alpha-L-rhamnosidase